MENLEQNHTYLIKTLGYDETVFSIKILLVTNKGYNIRWDDKNDTWEEIGHFNAKYNLIEDITDFFEIKKIDEIIEKVKTHFIKCYVCKGLGTIHDNRVTSGVSICPCCHGSKMILDSISSE